MAIEFIRGIPVLASLNIDETEAFYRNKLGFVTWQNYGDYLIMERGGLVLHFQACDDPSIPKNTSCYIYLRGVEELYAEYKAAGVLHPNTPNLSDQFYGLRDFAILDGDGNLLKFGQPRED
jgi:catechol 2,3-dioxygenase-like lactoylglutathione lyase family enzyme